MSFRQLNSTLSSNWMGVLLLSSWSTITDCIPKQLDFNRRMRLLPLIYKSSSTHQKRERRNLLTKSTTCSRMWSSRWWRSSKSANLSARERKKCTIKTWWSSKRWVKSYASQLCSLNFGRWCDYAMVKKPTLQNRSRLSNRWLNGM